MAQVEAWTLIATEQFTRDLYGLNEGLYITIGERLHEAKFHNLSSFLEEVAILRSEVHALDESYISIIPLLYHPLRSNWLYHHPQFMIYWIILMSPRLIGVRQNIDKVSVLISLSEISRVNLVSHLTSISLTRLSMDNESQSILYSSSHHFKALILLCLLIPQLGTCPHMVPRALYVCIHSLVLFIFLFQHSVQCISFQLLVGVYNHSRFLLLCSYPRVLYHRRANMSIISWFYYVTVIFIQFDQEKNK